MSEEDVASDGLHQVVPPSRADPQATGDTLTVRIPTGNSALGDLRELHLHFHLATAQTVQIAVGDSIVQAAAGSAAGIYSHAATRPYSINQLPAPEPLFTGRQEEVNTVEAWLQNVASDGYDGPVVLAIAGMPGVGKSSLAIQVANRHVASFPDAQLYVDLQATEDQTPIAPRDVLARFLADLGVMDLKDHTQIQDRAARFRSLIADTRSRSLILLDNASSAEQVRHLIPGVRTCAVLITSRTRLDALDVARILDLEPMNPDDALRLLEQLVGKSRLAEDIQSAHRVLAVCGNLPLAVRLAGAQLRQQKHWQLSQYADQLEHEQGALHTLTLGERSLEGSFNLAYRDLGEDETHMFRLLGSVGACSFSAVVADVLLEEGPGTGRSLVDRLVSAQLVNPADNARYRLHHLLAHYAGDRLHDYPADERSAQSRLASYYITEARKHSHDLQVPMQLAMGTGDTAARQSDDKLLAARVQEALAWFKREYDLLQHLLHLSRDAQDWNAVQAIVQELVSYFHFRSLWPDQERTLSLALEAATASDDTYGIGLALANRGDAISAQGRWNDALTDYRTALNIFVQADDPRSKAATLSSMGLAYTDLGQWDQAETVLQEAFTTYSSLDDSIGKATVQVNLGNLLREQGRLELGRQQFEEALSGFRALGNLIRNPESVGPLGHAG